MGRKRVRKIGARATSRKKKADWYELCGRWVPSARDTRELGMMSWFLYLDQKNLKRDSTFLPLVRQK